MVLSNCHIVIFSALCFLCQNLLATNLLSTQVEAVALEPSQSTGSLRPNPKHNIHIHLIERKIFGSNSKRSDSPQTGGGHVEKSNRGISKKTKEQIASVGPLKIVPRLELKSKTSPKTGAGKLTTSNSRSSKTNKGKFSSVGPLEIVPRLEFESQTIPKSPKLEKSKHGISTKTKEHIASVGRYINS